jgi:hypothetical protein
MTSVGASPGAPRGNRNALKHGKYTRTRRAVLRAVREHIARGNALVALAAAINPRARGEHLAAEMLVCAIDAALALAQALLAEQHALRAEACATAPPPGRRTSRRGPRARSGPPAPQPGVDSGGATDKLSVSKNARKSAYGGSS